MEGPTSLLSLDVEVLDLVLSRLTAKESVHLAVTCSYIWQVTQEGSHAAHRWRGHCEGLLGSAVVDYLAIASDSEEGSSWHRLYNASRHLDAVHWSAASTKQLGPAGSNAHVHCQRPHQLARCGHVTLVAGSHLVLLGGHTRDGSVVAMDVCALDAARGIVAVPQLFGRPPPALSHPCAAVVKLQQDSLLQSQVAEAAQLHQQQRQLHQISTTSNSSTLPSQQQQAGSGRTSDIVADGHTIVLFGGLTAQDMSLGGHQLYVLWLAADATWGVWLQVETTGHAPEPRAYACCQATRNSSQLLIFGGWTHGSIEGTINADLSVVDGYLLLCVYLLDVNSLAWTRQPTWPLDEVPRPGHVMIGPSTCPGPRKQAMCCSRVSPVTGHEEFVVLGGCGSDGLASCVPYALDLETYVWTMGPVMGYLPPARDAAALMQISHEWLLLIGGKSPQGEPLSDVQRLHLPSLAWRPPPLVYDTSSSSSPAVSLRRLGKDTVNFTATAGFVIGGSRDGPYGTVLVPRLEVLVPGPPMALSFKQLAATSAAAELDNEADEGGFFSSRCVQQQGQHQRALADGCDCGGCCCCVSHKAAAAGSCGIRTLHAFEPDISPNIAVAEPGHLEQQEDTLAAMTPQVRGLSPSVMFSSRSTDSLEHDSIGPAAVWNDTSGLTNYPASGASSIKGLTIAKNTQYSAWQNEIEPAAEQPDNSQQTASQAAVDTRFAPYYHEARGERRLGQQQQEWQPPKHSVMDGVGLAQVLAASLVLLLGLLLVYPSFLLQEVASE